MGLIWGPIMHSLAETTKQIPDTHKTYLNAFYKALPDEQYSKSVIYIN
jgi:hypothetical protein